MTTDIGAAVTAGTYAFGLGPVTGTCTVRDGAELVTLVAHGSTDAEIAAQLYISIRDARSHLDRVQDKIGCRRRADLTPPGP